MPEARVFHTQQVHYLRKDVTYADTTAVTVGTLPAGALIVPAMSGMNVSTAYNDSGTDLIDIGTTADDDLYATNLDVSAVGFKPLDEAVSLYVAAETTLTATYAGQNSNASAGVGQIVIAYVPADDG